MSLRNRALASTLAAAATLLSGCAGTPRIAPRGNGALTLKGSVHGGQQPITQSTIQLYAVGLTGDGTASKPLLTALVQTDSQGNFDISNKYTCPSDTALVYLVATGGNPGLSSGLLNPNISMMAALGPCGSLATATNVWVDELTTIGSLSPLAGFMSSYAALGSGTGDAYALNDAFDLVSEFTDTTIGQVPGPNLPDGFYASQAEINTLGDILAPCINSGGGIANDGSPCGTLFKLTTPSGGVAPTDTIGAALQILKHPTTNLNALLGLIPSNPPYLPTLTAAPPTIAPAILPIIQTPVISLPSGAYTGAQTVTITDGAAGYPANPTIFYSTTPNPTPDSFSVYTGPVPITLATTLTAYAAANNYINSPNVSASYTFTTPVIPTLKFGPNTRTFTNSILVSIASSVGGTQIYYTVDGSQPDPTSSTPYSGPFLVTHTTTVNAIGVTAQYPNTAVTSTTFSVDSGHAPQTITTVAGTLIQGYSGDGGPAVAAQFNSPNAIAFDRTGNMYIADTYNNVVRKVDTNGNISTFAGTYVGGYYNGRFCGDRGPANRACLNGPSGLAFDSIGNLYIADAGNSAVRIVSLDGTINTFAGNGNVDYDRGGNGGFSDLVIPTSLAIDASDNLYITDLYNSSVFKVTHNGTFSLFSSGLSFIKTIAIEPSGNLLVAASSAVYRINLSTGAISLAAGNGENRFSGDGGPALAASMLQPTGLAVDQTGNIFVSDPYAGVVREITPSGTIYRIAGPGDGMTPGDGGNATDASLFGPTGLAIDASGNLYIAGAGGNVIRKVTAGPPPTTTAPPVATPVEGDYVKASMSVSLASATPSAIIYYTTDGSQPTPNSTLYTGPVSISDLTYLQAYASSPGILDSGLFIGDYLVTLHPTAVPTFSPAPGSYFGPQAITITSTTPGATFYYTIDGSTPTKNSTLYTGPFMTSLSGQINAIATLPGNHDSRPGSANYTINAAPPVFSVKPGLYYDTQMVSLSSATSGANIYYTTDQTPPSSTSNLYTPGTPIVVSKSTYLSAVAITSTVLANSPTVSAYYIITPNPPVLSPSPGQYSQSSNPLSVTISSTTSGASIYYTLNGTNPSFDSTGAPTGNTTLYAGPIQVASTESILATAVMSPLDNSSATGGLYSITPAPPVFSVPAGTYNTIQHITITSATPGTDIYYSLNGAYPNTLYTGPITLSDSRSLSAIGRIYGLSATVPVTNQYFITGTISTIAGNGVPNITGDGAQATAAHLSYPRGVAVDGAGNVFIAERQNVRKIAVGGLISTFGPPTSSTALPSGVAVDRSGNIYISDVTGKIESVSPSGAVSVLYSAPPTHPAGSLYNPESIAVSPNGTVYFNDAGSGPCTSQVVALSGLTLLVGQGCALGGQFFSPDAGIGNLQAQLNGILPVAVDAAGVVYFAQGDTIFKVGRALLTKLVSGGGNIGGMAFDPAGNLYFTQADGVFKRSSADGVIIPIAGSSGTSGNVGLYGNSGYNGDGINAIGAELNNPEGIAVDAAGNLYIADRDNHRIRKITPPQ
jgi:sugar lactone lactonase YvrE